MEEAGRLSATDLHRAGRHLASVVDPDRDERQAEQDLDREDRAAHLGRFLTVSDDGCGAIRVRGRGSIEDGAILRAALLPLTKPEPPSTATSRMTMRGGRPRSRGGRSLAERGKSRRPAVRCPSVRPVTELHDTEIDGVRCFWVDTGRPTLAAQLVFRQGVADEPLPESGWLHLLEHLALHGRGGGALQVNGSVSLLLTSFDAHGPPAEVADHLREVTAWLVDPRFVELERERGVLRAEAETRGGPVTGALGWRYGAQGPGVCAYPEPGLARATADPLRERASRVFTAGNAVLLLDGPPPDNLRLELPDRRLQAPPQAIPCEESLPAAYVDGPGVVVSGVVSRSHEATFVPDLLQRQLRRRLRDEAGGAYAPWAVYEPVDDDRAVVVAGSDLLPELHKTIATVVTELAKDLARRGPEAAALQELVVQRTQALHDPYAAFGVALRAGHAVLNGREPQTFDEIREELTATDVERVRGHLAEFSASMLVGLPPEADNLFLRKLELIPESPQARRRTFRNVNWPADRGELVVAPDRIELRAGGDARGAAVDDVIALFAFADGGRHVLRSDGYGINVDPRVWRRGEDAVAEIDRIVPADRHLPVPHESCRRSTASPPIGGGRPTSSDGEVIRRHAGSPSCSC